MLFSTDNPASILNFFEEQDIFFNTGNRRNLLTEIQITTYNKVIRDRIKDLCKKIFQNLQHLTDVTYSSTDYTNSFFDLKRKINDRCYTFSVKVTFF